MPGPMDQKTLVIVVGLIVLFMWMQPKGEAGTYARRPMKTYARRRVQNYEAEAPPVVGAPMATVPVSQYTGKKQPYALSRAGGMKQLYTKKGENQDYAMPQAGGMKSMYLQQGGGMAPVKSGYSQYGGNMKQLYNMPPEPVAPYKPMVMGKAKYTPVTRKY